MRTIIFIIGYIGLLITLGIMAFNANLWWGLIYTCLVLIINSGVIEEIEED